jgi:hypothetical protein
MQMIPSDSAAHDIQLAGLQPRFQSACGTSSSGVSVVNFKPRTRCRVPIMPSMKARNGFATATQRSRSTSHCDMRQMDIVRDETVCRDSEYQQMILSRRFEG